MVDSLHGKQQHCTLTHAMVCLSRHCTRHELKLLPHTSAGSSLISVHLIMSVLIFGKRKNIRMVKNEAKIERAMR